MMLNPSKRRRVTHADPTVDTEADTEAELRLLCREDYGDSDVVLPRKRAAVESSPAPPPLGDQTPPCNACMLPEDAVAYLEQDEHEELSNLKLAQSHPTAAVVPNYPHVVQRWKRVDHRPVLVEHMIDVGSHFRYATDTVALAVAYLDRFLSQEPVDHIFLDSLAAACLLVAAKFNETWTPKRLVPAFLREFGVSRPMLLHFEMQLLKLLDWHMNLVTPHAVLQRLLRPCTTHLKGELTRRAELLIDMAMSDTRSLHFLPFTMAVASLVSSATLINASDTLGSFLDLDELSVDREEVSRCSAMMDKLFDDARSSYSGSPTFAATNAAEMFGPIEPDA